MDPYKWSEVVPVFRVHPKIWVEGHEGTSEGLSEMYVTLYGTGFSYYEFWLKLQCYPCRSFSMYLRLGTFVLDFDSNKEWINEFNFILNNEYQEGWQEMYWTWLKWIMGGCTDPSPLLPQGYLPLYIDQSGSLSHGGWWRWLWLQFYHETYPYSDMLVGDSYKGVPSLKVPVLSSGEKELLAYYFGFEFSLTVAPEYAPDMTSIDFVPEGIIEGVPTIMMEPITDPMSLLFGLVPCELGIKLGKIYTETASTTFTINGGSSGDQDILNRLDELDAKITGLVQGAEGNILVKIDTVKGEILAGLADLDAKITAVSDGLATIETKIGTIQTDLTNLGASITAINGRLATIETNIGTIQLDIADINGKLASLDTSGLARIETSVGTILATLGDINTKTTVVGRLATIQTDIETIKGYVEGIDGDVVTIKTDIGTIKGTMSDIKNDTGLQPATIGLSILAAISAIAAAVMILRKVYLK
jgi:archaellum component FlaC